jgi:low affinity Fe/Cu permease
MIINCMVLIFVLQKVKEEDDAKIDQKLQLRLKQRRRLKRCKQVRFSILCFLV